MSGAPLKVAFLWHMHQPCYKDPRSGVYRLPWVRLHAVKDYYDMAARLDAYPRIKANFNLVPILVEQIRDYASGAVSEAQLELAAKSPDDMAEHEKLALIKSSFLGSRKTMIEPYARYRSLHDKCTSLDSEYKVRSAIRKCASQDFLDLQVWSNLSWVDPLFHDDPLIKELLTRARQFTEPMRNALLDKHLEIMRAILPKYRELADAGRIEITFSPYFHPIVPILCDSEVARVAMPAVDLPRTRLQVPEDVQMQMRLGVALHEEVFGRPPSGMWPPEGSVSDETLRLAHRSGIKWVATDEGILERSLGVTVRDQKGGPVTRPDLLYRPHLVPCDGGEVAVFFRDRTLSDLISFEYSALPAEDAAADFMGRLEVIRRELGDQADQSVVVVALDGENCWEAYDRDGDLFLKHLYSALSRAEGVETVLLSEVLEAVTEAPSLKSIYPGSWIDSNFAIWIGSAEDNTAWDMLSEAREHLVAKERTMSDADQEVAWRSVYAAEGSDWFWWFGGEHVCRHNPEYDALFRSHIRQIYDTMGIKCPARTLSPITSSHRGPGFVLEPVAIMRPVLDGRVTTFYEWSLAGLYESHRDVSRHTPAAPVITAVHFGFDHANLYLAIDTSVSPQSPEFTGLGFRLEFDCPVDKRITLRADRPCGPGATDLTVEPASDAAIRCTALETLELAVPFAEIGARPGDSISFRIAVLRGSEVLERRPFHEVIRMEVPSADFEAEMWGMA
jgi:alpha-amylase/alpha-mannosidase (GH57 family)